MQHLTVQANGAAFHVARTGTGQPLLLLHGWPEFWLTWEPVMARLADRFTLIAPDLRGFGDSDKPAGPFGPAGHAGDVLSLLDALGVDRIGVVGHDVGGAIMQPLARYAPDRFTGLFFFDFVYPGIGRRMAEPDRDLVSILPPDGDGPAPRRRDAGDMPELYRSFPSALGVSQGRVRRCAGGLYGQFPQTRQS